LIIDWLRIASTSRNGAGYNGVSIVVPA